MSHRIRVALRLAVVVPVLLALAPTSAHAAATLIAEPEEVDFGVVLPGRDSTRTVTLRNTGPDAAVLSEVYLVGDVDPFEFAGGSCELGVPMEPGNTCDLSVGFYPDAPGDEEVLLVAEGGPDDEPAVTLLTARSRPPGQLVVTPASVDFGSVRMGTSSPPQVVRLHNDGGIPITIETLIANGATIVSNSCGREVAPLATCEVALTFSPYPGTVTSDRASQSAALSVRALRWDKMPPTRFRVEVPLRATAVSASGAPFPSREQLATLLRGDLTRIVRATLRLVRGGPRGALELPGFRGGPHGYLGLEVHARTGKRWVVAGKATALVEQATGERLALRLTTAGRRMLAGSKRVRVKVAARFRAVDRSVVEAVTQQKTLRPKPAKRRRR